MLNTENTCLVLIIMGWLLISLLPGLASPQSNQTFPADRVLIVAGDHDYPPYQYLEGARATGFHVEVPRAVAEKQGLKLIATSGRLDHLRDQWFGVYRRDEPGWRLLVTVLLLVLALVAAVALVMFGWSATLRKKVDSRTSELNRELRERQAAEERERHLNQVLLAIRNVNQLIVREENEPRLLERATFNLVDTLGYFNAWIMLTDKEGGCRELAHAGFTNRRFSQVRKKLEHGWRPRCLERLRNGEKLVVTDRTAKQCPDCLLSGGNRKLAGLAAVLRHQGRDYGYLVASVPAKFADDGIEQELFVELVDDLAFALHKIGMVEALHRSEAKYRHLAESSEAVLWEYDIASDRWTYVAPQVSRILGYEPAEWTNLQFWIDRLHEHDRHWATAYCTNSTARGEAHEFEYRFRKKNGGYAWLRDVVQVDMADGKPYKLIGLMLDITERRQAADELADKHRMLELILDTIPVRVFWKDYDLNYLGCNQSFAQDSGLHSPRQLLGKNDYDMTWREQADIFRADDRQVMSSGQAKLKYDEMLTSPTGGNIWLRTSKVPLRDSGGEIVGILGTYEDITESREAREENQKLENQLRQSQKMEAVGRLAGGIAHDFNNMLQTIIGYAEMSLHDLSPGHPLQESLDEIKKAALHSADLTRQLLAFARKQTISPRIIDFNEQISGMLKMLERLLGEDLKLLWKPGPELWPVKMDPALLQQMLVNLAVNARDAIGGGGCLTITTDNVEVDQAYCRQHSDAVPGEYTMIAVADDGPGISPDLLEQIFEPFFTTKQIGKGTGLGLSTVYGIVRQSEGFIKVHSELGRGTVFKVYLPRYRSNHDQRLEEAIPRMAPRGSESILLVEDNMALLGLARKMLEKLGYQVLPATSPTEALQLMEQNNRKTQMLITDVVMPELSGRELWQRLRERGESQLRCLFMSGYTANVIAHHGILEDGINFIEKPFSAYQLACKVRAVLDERHGRAN